MLDDRDDVAQEKIREKCDRDRERVTDESQYSGNKDKEHREWDNRKYENVDHKCDDRKNAC